MGCRTPIPVPPLTETIAGVLRRGIADGAMRKGVDPLHLYISISALSYFYFSNAATLSTAFGQTFWVAVGLTALALVPAYFLPRRPPVGARASAKPATADA